MYEKYFGLADKPFKITPDPRYLWYSDQHKEAKLKVQYHIIESVGPIYLVADIGAGKTTTARLIREEFSHDENREVVYVFAPKLPTTNAFLRFVMEEFGVKTERSYASSLKNFENYLLTQYSEGKSPILLVDEAQNMNRDMLMLIQHLFNFSTNTEFLIQIALFSQPEIEKKLNRLKSLKSRLGVARINPFNLGQTKKMIQHRWTVAGGDKESFPFTDPAIEEMFRVSKGMPRTIVKLADEALLRTMVQREKEVTKDIIIRTIPELAL